MSTPLVQDSEKAVPEPAAPRTNLFIKVFYIASFFLVGGLAVAEMGLVAQQIHYNHYPFKEWKADLGLLIFISIWTFLSACTHTFWTNQIGAIMLTFNTIMWGVAAGIWNNVMPFRSRDCFNNPTFAASTIPFEAQCHKLVAIDAIGWTEFIISLFLMLVLLKQLFGVSTPTSKAANRNLYA